MIRRSILPAALGSAALAVLMLSPAFADEIGEVSRLHQAGDTRAALERADRYLAAQPKDAQMRFLKAVLLGDAQRAGEAVTLLERLAEDHPDLPEPYNNLAVMHAARGDFAKARAALDQALRLRPGYATAHENLGDVYAALAAQSYGTALGLEPNRAGVAVKLASARQLVAPLAAPSLAAKP